jgi:hypothetical protein
MLLRSALTIVDVSVVHPPSASTLSTAVATIGSVGVRRGALKLASYGRVEPNGYLFVPFSIESFGHVGVPTIKLVHDLGDDAASLGTLFTRARLVAGALRELSVGLSRIPAMHVPDERRVPCSGDTSVVPQRHGVPVDLVV